MKWICLLLLIKWRGIFSSRKEITFMNILRVNGWWWKKVILELKASHAQVTRKKGCCWYLSGDLCFIFKWFEYLINIIKKSERERYYWDSSSTTCHKYNLTNETALISHHHHQHDSFLSLIFIFMYILLKSTQLATLH